MVIVLYHWAHDGFNTEASCHVLFKIEGRAKDEDGILSGGRRRLYHAKGKVGATSRGIK
jgi:hypothetical protein